MITMMNEWMRGDDMTKPSRIKKFTIDFIVVPLVFALLPITITFMIFAFAIYIISIT
ncbi:MAG: hypothetical protein IE913_06835 [Halothiobacillus sp.]|nr:hypothetical protein [Halothiobacillus sp.]